MRVRGDILNNPNEGDKFAYWGEGGDAYGPGLAVLMDWSRTGRLHATRAILIAEGNDRDCPKLFERGEATEQAAPANREVIARPHNGDV